MKVVAAVIVVAAVAIGAWTATHAGGPPTRKGCITVVVAGSLGGQLVHACGANARGLCASERGHPTIPASRILPACRAAGIETGTQNARG